MKCPKQFGLKERGLYFSCWLLIGDLLISWLWCTFDNLAGPVSLTLLIQSPLLFGKCYFHISRRIFHSILLQSQTRDPSLVDQSRSDRVAQGQGSAQWESGLRLLLGAFWNKMIPFWLCCQAVDYISCLACHYLCQHVERGFLKTKVVPKKELRDSEKQILYDFIRKLLYYKW